jgi:hypothetical protein
MDSPTIVAVAILNDALDRLEEREADHGDGEPCAIRILYHAIQHISRPERDVYPKTRKGTKGRPVIRRA